MTLRVGVVQDGARRRYAVPRALARAGLLGAMYTDWFVAKGTWRDTLARILPDALARKTGGLLARRADDIPRDKVVQSLALALRLARARQRFASPEAFFAWEAEQKGRWILRHGVRSVDLWLGFVRNIPVALCAAAHAAGVPVVADQIIAPAAVEAELLARERERWPEWASGADADPAAVVDLERRTWPLLARVTCMSPFLRDALVAQGVEAGRIDVIPYPFDAAEWTVPDRARRAGPVTVGCVGAVNLRKGAPYFCEVARRLRSEHVRFVMVGGAELAAPLRERVARDVQLAGAVPRAEVAAWLERCDVFYFPSTCEGSAGTVMEAMASGLPVVTTHESGSIVRDGVDGFVVRNADLDGTAERIERLVRDAELRRTLGASARAHLERYDLDWYARELADLVARTVRGMRA